MYRRITVLFYYPSFMGGEYYIAYWSDGVIESLMIGKYTQLLFIYNCSVVKYN
ncbi:hypothetical protein PPBDW_u10034 [Photobacterium kishitanii]|nr:hypothetical protein PPBDW_u10034 [Photobacterium kishitanii]